MHAENKPNCAEQILSVLTFISQYDCHVVSDQNIPTKEVLFLLWRMILPCKTMSVHPARPCLLPDHVCLSCKPCLLQDHGCASYKTMSVRPARPCLCVLQGHVCGSCKICLCILQDISVLFARHVCDPARPCLLIL